MLLLDAPAAATIIRCFFGGLYVQPVCVCLNRPWNQWQKNMQHICAVLPSMYFVVQQIYMKVFR